MFKISRQYLTKLNLQCMQWAPTFAECGDWILRTQNGLEFFFAPHTDQTPLLVIYCISHWTRTTSSKFLGFQLANAKNLNLCLFFLPSLLLNEGIPRALKVKKLRLKNPMVLPSIFEFFLVFQIWGQNTIGGQFLEHCHLIYNCPWFLKWFLIFQISGYYLQKVNAKCPQISDEKYKFFFSIDKYFFLFF